MTDEPTYTTVPESIRDLSDLSGQSYIRATDAWDHIRPLITGGDSLDAEYLAKPQDLWDAEEIENQEFAQDVVDYCLSAHLADAQRPAIEARGLTSLHPHEMIVTASDVSEIMVAAIGEDPSDATMAGSGFTADERHKENMGVLKRTFLPGVQDGEE